MGFGKGRIKVKVRFFKENRIQLILTAVICAASFALSGCDKNDIFYESEIVVEKNGQLTENIVESFDKDYYNLDELKSEFDKEISEYNESIGSEEIKLKSFELEDGNVFVTLTFTGPSDYENFIKEDMFVGTIDDAYDNGYSMDVSLKGVEKGDIISKVQIMGMKDKEIIILSEPVKVHTYKDVAYVSANVEVTGKKEVRVLQESGGLAYIVLK